MPVSQQTYAAVAGLFERVAGIRLAQEKKQLIAARLRSLALQSGADSIDEYVNDALQRGDAEQITKIIERLTTNETYFFREPQHFEFLQKLLERRDASRPVRLWSAASSSGEEAYSAAMVLADRNGPAADWEVVGTDLSGAMIARARAGLYEMDRIDGIGRERLRRYCLKGSGEYSGKLLIARELRQRMRFIEVNLMRPIPDEHRLGMFDVIFLRNVLIYFDDEAKRAIVGNVLAHLAPEGHLIVGRAESLANLACDLAPVEPSIYERAG